MFFGILNIVVIVSIALPSLDCVPLSLRSKRRIFSNFTHFFIHSNSNNFYPKFHRFNNFNPQLHQLNSFNKFGKLLGSNDVDSEVPYDCGVYENIWQDYWETNDLYKPIDPKLNNNVPYNQDNTTPYSTSSPTTTYTHDTSQNPVSNDKKYYILSMIPYVSGKGLHVGHLLGYTVVDVIARYKRLQGFNVLNPMGYDSFGIPTQLYSKKQNLTPEEAVEQNVNNFRQQLKAMGYSFDYSRELVTSDVSYYKWTQWIFQQMYLKNLAYLDTDYVNYCSELDSELSNEEVVDGKSVRGGYDVYKKLKSMWKLRITQYAQRLYDDLKTVDFPERLLHLQRTWINPQKGFLIPFKLLINDNHSRINSVDSVNNSVTNLDNKVGGLKNECIAFVDDIKKLDEIKSIEMSVLQEDILSYCSPERVELVRELLEETLRKSNLQLLDQRNRRKVFSGLYFTNPHNLQQVPLFITNAAINTNQPINSILNYSFDICNIANTNTVSETTVNTVDTSENYIPTENTLSNSSTHVNKYYKEYVNYNMKDWVFSRNRGWGEPIPVDSSSDELKPLPVKLSPSVVETMPQWAGSSWHFLRFTDPNNQFQPFNKSLASYWLPVDLYVGGIEHAVSHLLYSRFWNKFLFDIGVSPVSEPFRKILIHGIIKSVRYFIPQNTLNALKSDLKDQIINYNTPLEDSQSDLDPENFEVPDHLVMKYKNKYVLKSDKSIQVQIRTCKMSKSRGNIASPEEIIHRFGADALRLHLLFQGPVDKDRIWSIQSIQGPYKLLKSINTFVTNFFKQLFTQSSVNTNVVNNNTSDSNIVHPSVKSKLNEFINVMTYNMENFKLNKVSEFFTFLRLMKLWDEEKKLTLRVVEIFLITLSPFAPHLAEHLWYTKHRLSHGEADDEIYKQDADKKFRSITLEKWPQTVNI
ncbi:tRNA synthetases class I (I L M and V) family protein [Theileria parva strain Muguga]|uniref:leucine--tRNA ligase n=1 Tax=Theileria parva TaxID=5875 RepID=Q4MZU4_THEPA|nr:tRNA synthetases class I (I L M and V) family protein [Theileria parva strain Muguga]EAN31153.1 tRNA synthetases class I (I L M and V) family protein [Theileria parva strain Muguga]|eukprot:XP_763436.1 leucyl-tRNA synthetase [Theileria parva strain Muguga]